MICKSGVSTVLKHQISFKKAMVVMKCREVAGWYTRRSSTTAVTGPARESGTETRVASLSTTYATYLRCALMDTAMFTPPNRHRFSNFLGAWVSLCCGYGPSVCASVVGLIFDVQVTRGKRSDQHILQRRGPLWLMIGVTISFVQTVEHTGALFVARTTSVDHSQTGGVG